MLQVKEADFLAIHKDSRGFVGDARSCFAGCLIPGGMTRLIAEGVDFEIIPTPKPMVKNRRHARATFA